MSLQNNFSNVFETIRKKRNTYGLGGTMPPSPLLLLLLLLPLLPPWFCRCYGKWVRATGDGVVGVVMGGVVMPPRHRAAGAVSTAAAAVHVGVSGQWATGGGR